MEPSHPGGVEAESLEAMVDDLAARLTALPEASFAHRPGDGVWSAAEVVAHMTEMMPYWSRAATDAAHRPGGRIGRALDDPDRIGAIAGADTMPRAEALARLRHAAHETSSSLRALDERDWHAVVEHYSRGSLTVGDAVRELIVEHARGHVEQALSAAGGASMD